MVLYALKWLESIGFYTNFDRCAGRLHEGSTMLIIIKNCHLMGVNIFSTLLLKYTQDGAYMYHLELSLMMVQTMV